MSQLFTLIYGAAWEDISYYSDLHTAKCKLLIQTNGFDREQERFYPMLYEYHVDDRNIYQRRKGAYIVNYKTLQHALKQDATTIKDLMSEDSLTKLIEFKADL
jgi:hypothetical protein